MAAGPACGTWRAARSSVIWEGWRKSPLPPDGGQVAAIEGAIVRRWGLPQWRELPPLPVPAEVAPGLADATLAYAPDGARLMAAGPERLVVWDLAAPDAPPLVRAFTTALRQVAIAPDGATLATAGARKASSGISTAARPAGASGPTCRRSPSPPMGARRCCARDRRPSRAIALACPMLPAIRSGCSPCPLIRLRLRYLPLEPVSSWPPHGACCCII